MSEQPTHVYHIETGYGRQKPRLVARAIYSITAKQVTLRGDERAEAQFEREGLQKRRSSFGGEVYTNRPYRSRIPRAGAHFTPLDAWLAFLEKERVVHKRATEEREAALKNIEHAKQEIQKL